MIPVTPGEVNLNKTGTIGVIFTGDNTPSSKFQKQTEACWQIN